MIDGRLHVLETPLKADFTIVRAWKADTWGNLVFRKTARNFSPMMCMAGKVTIVEAEHIVKAGELDPDQVHLPGIFVHRIIQAKDLKKWIERRTVRKQA
jgi:3-oxoacid CoA-transferase subunit A